MTSYWYSSTSGYPQGKTGGFPDRKTASARALWTYDVPWGEIADQALADRVGRGHRLGTVHHGRAPPDQLTRSGVRHAVQLRLRRPRHRHARRQRALLSIGSLTALGALAAAGIPLSRTTKLLFVLWSLGLAAAAIFPASYPEFPDPVSGEIHLYACLIAFLSLPAAGFTLRDNLRGTPHGPSWSAAWPGAARPG